MQDDTLTGCRTAASGVGALAQTKDQNLTLIQRYMQDAKDSDTQRATVSCVTENCHLSVTVSPHLVNASLHTL